MLTSFRQTLGLCVLIVQKPVETFSGCEIMIGDYFFHLFALGLFKTQDDAYIKAPKAVHY